MTLLTLVTLVIKIISFMLFCILSGYVIVCGKGDTGIKTDYLITSIMLILAMIRL